MKTIILLLGMTMLVGCNLLNSSIIIDPPNFPTINVCENVATDNDVTVMKEKIESQAFKDERMERAKTVTNDYCFEAYQVVNIMDSFLFEDAKLEIAKHLYEDTTDKENYDLAIDALTHKGDRDDLRAYIANYN
ncbi:MAG: DUF4476 domain-containing protein [Crocinitomicaceae bacterium]|nr:DUF4476 domain-containing protein [Crocinitomicaceae bacterium]